jgi:hypothetical protein
MKNKFLSLLAAFGVAISATSAQDEPMTNKNGQAIMPVAGDIGLGFNAVPLLSFVGNSFNGNTNNTYAGSNRFVSNLNTNAIFGKYMLTDKTAIRAHLRIAGTRTSINNSVFDNTANNPDSLVNDNLVINNSLYVLGGGYEMRRGNGRLRGFYGAEAFVGYGRPDQRRYSYGNAFGALNPAPTSTDWDGQGGVNNESPTAERKVSQLGGSQLTLGVRPFIGVEYFFAPRISIGSEFGWSIAYNRFGRTTSTYEAFESSTNNIISRTEKGSITNQTSVDTDNFNGALFLMFYF